MFKFANVRETATKGFWCGLKIVDIEIKGPNTAYTYIYVHRNIFVTQVDTVQLNTFCE